MFFESAKMLALYSTEASSIADEVTIYSAFEFVSFKTVPFAAGVASSILVTSS